MVKFISGLIFSAFFLSQCTQKSTGKPIILVGPTDSSQASVDTDPEDESDPVRPAWVQAELDKIRQTLDTIALDLACTVDENCIALGADDNACGIPLEWLIFSTQAPRYIEVEKLLERSFQLDNTYPNSRYQVCGGPSEPKLQCAEGLCKVVPFDP